MGGFLGENAVITARSNGRGESSRLCLLKAGAAAPPRCASTSQFLPPLFFFPEILATAFVCFLAIRHRPSHSAMAPKVSKGKAKAAEKEQALAAERLTRARFRRAFVNEEMVGKLRWLVAGPNNEHGATMLKPVSAQPLEGDVPIFTCFLKMGLVPPLSEFLVAMMESYGLHLAQLHPNA